MEWLAENQGAVKWGILGATILALEFVGDVSLTEACHKASEHKIGKYVVPMALGFTVAHLAQAIPREIDPYYYIADAIDYIKERTG